MNDIPVMNETTTTTNYDDNDHNATFLTNLYDMMIPIHITHA